MRIALIAHTDAPWTPHYVRCCQRAGHDVTVISFAPDRIDGVHTLFVGHKSYPLDRSKHVFLTRVPAIRSLLHRLNPDVVFAPYLISNGLTAALAWSGPMVVSARGADVLEQPGSLGLPRWIRRRLVRFVCHRARIVHAVSDELLRALLSCGVPAEKIECFPVGVDTTQFTPTNLGTDGASNIICTRAHDPVYENHVIVRALSALREMGRVFHCLFVGSGRLLAKRREQVRALDLEDVVSFLPRVDHARMPSLLRAAQIYVSASSSDGTSSSLLEAMATGLLPVVTRIPANQAWIRDGKTGLLFAVGDHLDLARALARAMDDAPLRAIARASNRQLVELKGRQEVNSRLLIDLLSRAAAPMASSRSRLTADGGR